MSRAIVVVGSLNMDFVVSTDHLPAPGETVLGQDFQMIPGGKGANQACAAGRLAGGLAQVRMAGRVGYDVFGDHLKASLSAAGVDVTTVHATRSKPTGVALIWVDSAGQNSIVVASGANHALAAADVEAMRPVFQDAGHVLFQLETPIETVAAALALAREVGAVTILDPAPAQVLSKELLASVDILTPNESEACILLGETPRRVPLGEAPQITCRLRALGARAVVLKLGDQGSYFCDGTSEIHCPSFAVTVRDTTAAGDIFNAGLAVALSEGLAAGAALSFASAAAAISVTRLGAQASIPTRAEVEAFLNDKT
jgi:ribokinase